MKNVMIAGVLALCVAGSGSAQAAGCVSGAVVGGVAGHFAGHHGLLGAAAGCAIGHHRAKKNQQMQNQQNGQPAQGQEAPNAD